MAVACIYLAGKLEDPSQLKIRDLMNVSHALLNDDDEDGGDGCPPVLSLDNYYYNLRENICQAELLVLRMVNFETQYDHPHRYLLHYLTSVRDWMAKDVWQK